MKKVFLFGLLLVLVCASISLALTADEYVAQGDAYLEAHDTINAYQCYLNAYNLNNNHQGANFGLAALTIPHFLIDGGDAAVKSFLDTNGISLIGNIYDLSLYPREVEQNSTIPQMQSFVESHILPYAEQTLGYLNKITPGFQKTIKKKMQPYDAWKDAQINDGEMYIRQYQSGKLVEVSPWGGEEALILPPKLEVGIWWRPYNYDEDVISEVESISETVTTPAGTFTNCVKVVTTYPPSEWDPNEYKDINYYKQGVGWVKYVTMENSEVIGTCTLISYSVTGTGYWPLEEGNKWDYNYYYYGEYLISSFSYTVSSVSSYQEIQGKDRECDYGDIMAAKALVNLIKGVLDVACGYNLDFDPEECKGLNLQEILNKYPNLLAIRNQTRMNYALSDFKGFLDSLITSYNSINDETDPQDNDILCFPEDDKEFVYLKNDIKNLLSNLRQTLDTGGVDFDITDLTLKLSYYSTGTPEYPKRIDLSRFFTNPVTRTNLEPLQFDEDDKIILSSVWNIDQTFNGILPNLTKQELIGYFRHYCLNTPEILDENTVYLCGETGKNIEDISSIKIYRRTDPKGTWTLLATLPPVSYSEGFGPFFEYLDTNATSDIYYYNTVVYFNDGSYLCSPSMRAARKLYVDTNANGIYKGTGNEPYKYIGIATQYGNIGSTVYVSGGTYNLEEDPEVSDEDKIYADEPGIYIENRMKFIGSCNPNNWVPNLNSYPTIIDATGKWSGFDIDYYANDVSIENFIIKNSENGIGIGSSNNTIKNCLVYNCNFTGINLWNWESSGNSIINCTLVDNYNGIEGAVCDTIKNTIIAENENRGVNLRWCNNFFYNDVWGNGKNYAGILDQTGINGNISENPLFVDPENGNYRLSENSPCIGTGENGIDMGAHYYIKTQKGDINGDTSIDISDVILCLRMAVGIDPFNLSTADLNNDGIVDISDVILILRKAVGLD